MDIEKKLYKKVFVEPLRSNQVFEVTQKKFYAKPTWKKWLRVFEDYNVYYGLSDARSYNPHLDNWDTRKIDISDTPFNSPLYNLDILKFFDDSYNDKYSAKQLNYIRFRVKKIITCMCDISVNEVGNPVPIFTGNYEYVRIHPFKCLTSAHSILNKPLKTIVFEKKKNFVGPKVNLENKTQVKSLQDILSYFENVPFGFMEIENHCVSHIHFWCFVTGWDKFANSGFAAYPEFNIDRFLEICKVENTLVNILSRGYKECYEQV